MAAAVVVCLSAGWLGSALGGQMGGGEWYEQLRKPALTPPGWVFPVAWTTLYVLMGVAGGLVWWWRGRGGPVAAALVVFAVQLILNVAWSGIFFGLQRIGWAMVDLAALWVAIVATMVLFFRVRPAAGWLLVPYLAWVTFAGYLNAQLLRLN